MMIARDELIIRAMIDMDITLAKMNLTEQNYQEVMNAYY